MTSVRAKRLLARLPEVHGDERKARLGMGEQGELDAWAKHYGLKRKGYDLPDDWRCGTPARIRDWEKARESDADLRKRVAAAIEAAE